MNTSNRYYAAALVKQRAMHLEGQGNFYHERHIRQFCEYVDLIAAGIKKEIMAALPQIIANELKNSKYQIEVDKNSLRQVEQAIEQMFENVFGRR